ncbi:transporter substrate-binding domain-containing protein [Paracrocinitomix mangrovi]|uniref:transporter substrate-binding domain-containing protein n=1 Tax=Paracrocinitomix mangrovi TaxID=2862509 RepID=UPI001C8D7EC7|nr:transporter substrate-binding domain-containing protein [Paracrocinitomix mangrovi]UKN01838.1 transporter substrate-binding domain-containing protein [Paracrocinitomix mangrovi]
MIRLLPLFLLCLLCSCQEEEEETVEIERCHRDWEEVQKDSVLTILAENGPASYFIYRGRNMGFEYELLHEFCKDMNIRLQVRMVNDLDEMYELLANCEGDIVACNLTITENRKRYVDFSTPHILTHDVLIQRIPADTDTVNQLVTEIEQLYGKTIHVWKNSSFYEQIVLINDKLNLNLTIVPTSGELITEELIRQVSDGEIDYTIADENVAKIDLNYYSNLDISLKLSEDREIAFALRKGSGRLLDTLNFWLNDRSNRSTIGEVKRKYFDRKNLTSKAQQPYSSLVPEGQLSPYDEIIKEEAAKIGWDWRLISAIIYQESKFETWKTSWAGAFGIFQFMPSTASAYGISRNSSADAQIKAGVKKLNKNFQQWLEEIPDSTEAMKFTLATFNTGRAHIDDARALCEKYEKDQNVWDDNVNKMLLNLSKPKYYRDEVVKNGYCRGVETYEYVIEVLQRFEEYKSAFPEPGD